MTREGIVQLPPIRQGEGDVLLYTSYRLSVFVPAVTRLESPHFASLCGS